MCIKRLQICVYLFLLLLLYILASFLLPKCTNRTGASSEPLLVLCLVLFVDDVTPDRTTTSDQDSSNR